MDRVIKRWDSLKSEDLRYCDAHGVAYQCDMTAKRVFYNSSYLKKCESYDSEIAKAVNTGRMALVRRYVPSGTLLDYGAAAGAFLQGAIEAGYQAKGFDVIDEVADRLKEKHIFADNPENFQAVTLWDTIEHIEHPEAVLKRISRGSFLFVSIPVFVSLDDIKASRHYRPGEHLYYWTANGFVEWMTLYGYRLLEQSDHEVKAGRESIGAFAFCRDLPDFNDFIAQYNEMHSSRFYGSSATELHLTQIAGIVRKLNPKSILDYGCGRSDLVAHFWMDGAREIGRYDPAIGKYKRMPEGKFDLVLACDVMEHIPMASVDRVLAEIKDKSARAIFTISTKLARAKLPNGQNAHVTLLTKSEWKNWIVWYFGTVSEIETEWEHELLLVAGA